jgi:hypothetical protein
VSAAALTVSGPAQADPTPAPSATSTPPTEADVASLRARNDALTAELVTATTAYEQQRVALDQALQADYEAQRANEAAEQRVRDAHAALGRAAAASYKRPNLPGGWVLVSKGTTAYNDQQAVDLAMNRGAEAAQHQIEVLTAAEAEAERGVELRRTLTLAAQAKQREVDASLAALQAQAQAAATELATAAAALAAEQARQAAEAAAAAAAAAGSTGIPYTDQPGVSPTGNGATCQADPVSSQVINGFLPEANLCFLRTATGHRLRPSAAKAFDAMADAFARDNGTALCVTDSYRSYEGQVAVYKAKPSLAAIPGRSNHGLGLAVDLCGGIQVFGSPAHAWMDAHAGQYGFVHPDWAEPDGSRPEPWHWEFRGAGSN